MAVGDAPRLTTGAGADVTSPTTGEVDLRGSHVDTPKQTKDVPPKPAPPGSQAVQDTVRVNQTKPRAADTLPDDTSPKPTSRSEKRAGKPGQATTTLARTAGANITDVEVDAAANNLGLQRRLAAVIEQHGNRAASSQAIDGEILLARGEALRTLVDVANLTAALHAAKIAVPDTAEHDPTLRRDELFELLLPAFAAANGLAPNSEAARDALENTLATQLEAALWAPHLKILASTFGKDPARTTHLRDELFSRYAERYGFLAPAIIADELRQGGAAAKIAQELLAEAAPPPSHTPAPAANGHLYDALLRMHAPPTALRGLYLEGAAGSLRLPGPDQPWSAEQRAGVAILQRHLVLAGVLEESKIVAGRLDRGTRETLNGLGVAADSRGTTEIPAELLRRIAQAAAESMEGREALVGDLVLGHPALLAHRSQGGKLDAVALVTAYLESEGLLSPGSGTKDPEAWAQALAASLRRPLHAEALRRATVQAQTSTLRGDAALLGRSVLLLESGEGAVLLHKPALSEAALRVRLAPLAEPTHERGLTRKDLGFLHRDEPVVALRLMLSQMLQTAPPVSADGIVESRLTATDLQNLLLLRFGTDAPAAADKTARGHWQTVIAAVERGQLTIANLAEDLPPSDQLATATNAVLQDLRGIVQSIRMSTVPTDGSSVALQARRAALDPVRFFARPVVKAHELIGAELRLSTRDRNAAAEIRAEDIDALHHLITRLQGELTRVAGTGRGEEIAALLGRYREHSEALAATRQGLVQGTLRLGETAVVAQPANAVLELQGRQTLGLYLDAADLLQSRHRAANDGLAGKVTRTGITAWHHLYRMPGFGDSVAVNAVQDWTLVALRAEMAERGKGPEVAIDPKGPDADKKRAALLSVDASMLRYLVEHHGDYLGRGIVDNLITGEPAPILPPAKARALLQALAAEMEAGRMPAWASANVGPQDVDPRVREAKAVVQAALRQINGGDGVWRNLMGGKNLAAIDELATRLAGLDGESLAPFLKGLAIQQGLVSARDAGQVRSPELNPAMLRALVELGKKTRGVYADSDRATRDELQRVIGVLEQAANAKGGLTLSRLESTGTSERAARRLAQYLASALGSVGDMGAVDFDAILSQAPGDLRVRGPVHNRTFTDSAQSLDELSDSVGRAVPHSEAREALSRTYTFDPRRAVETAWGNFVLFRYMMGTFVGYDLTVKPLVHSGRALIDLGAAETKNEQGEAVDRLYQTWEERAVMQVMFTGYHTGMAFWQQLYDDARHGKLDSVVGSGVVILPMAYKATAHTIRRMSRYFQHGEILANSEVVSARGLGGAVPSSSRVAAARGVQALGMAKDVITSPKEQLAVGYRGVRGLAQRVLDGDGSVRTLGVAEGGVPSLSKLAEPKHIRGSTTWQVVSDGTPRKLTIRNSDLLNLAKKYYTGQSITSTLDAVGLKAEERAVVAILQRHRGTSVLQLKALNRAGWVMDTSTRLRVMRLSAQSEIRSTVQAVKNTPQAIKNAGATIKRVVKHEPKPVMPGAPKVIATTPSVAAQQLARAKVIVGNMRAELAAKGVQGVSADIVQRAGHTMKGQLKSPSFYLVVAFAGREFLIDLGDTINDPALSDVQKMTDILSAAGKAGGTVGLGIALSELGARYAPRTAAVLGKLSSAGLAMMIPSALDGSLIESVLDPLFGHKDPLEAMRYWRQVGIPETSFLKIDADRYAGKRFWNADGGDINSIEHNQTNLVTSRTSAWYFDEQSPMHARLRQLYGQPKDASGSPVRQPQKLSLVKDLERIKRFEEPEYPAVALLRNVPPALRSTRALATFDAGAFEQEVRGRAGEIFATVPGEGGAALITVDTAALRKLLAQKSLAGIDPAVFAKLSAPQKAELKAQLDQQVESVTRWTSMFINGMGISQAHKEKALTKLVHNLAATNLVSAAAYERANALRAAGKSTPTIAEVSVEDAYTLVLNSGIKSAFLKP